MLLFCTFTVVFSLCRRAESRKVSASDEKTVPVPIIMYHSVCDKTYVSPKYIVSPAMFENDMKYLKEHGYTAVFIKDLDSFVNGKSDLPEKPVIITLDDGFLNNLTNALPILKKYGMKAVVSAVGEFTEENSKINDRNPSYAYLTFDDIKSLYDSSVIEIGNHTYAMHRLKGRKGCSKNPGESTDEYRKVLKADLERMQNLMADRCGVTPYIFTYPYGYMSKEGDEVIKDLNFTAALTCTEKINYIKKGSSLMSLCRFNRPSTISTENFMKKIKAPEK